MGLIFDTSIWITVASGKQEADPVVAFVGDEPVFVSVISIGELELSSFLWKRRKLVT
jgi:predicted nucleic acid-binding protein